MKQIKAIIFDCDGTLVDSEEAHFSAWQRTMQNRNHEFKLEQHLLYAGKPDATIAKLLSQVIGLACHKDLLAEKHTHFREILKKGLPPIQPTVDFVHKAAKEKERLGLKLGLASAAEKQDILMNLKNLGIEIMFDIVLSGHDDLAAYSDPEGVNKPKPYIYLHAAKLLNLSPQECVVIEDSHTGVTAGKHAGCHTVAVPNRFTRHHDLSAATIKLDTFSHISVEQFLQMISK